MRFFTLMLPLGALLVLPRPAAASPSPSDTSYYDAQAQHLPSRVGAVRLIVTEARLPTGCTQKIFAASGALLEQISYADAQATTRAGVAWRWFATGELRGRRSYQNGQLEGQYLLYYPNGVLQEVAVYQKGQEKSRQCYAPDGLPSPACPPEQTTGRVYAQYQYGRAGLTAEVSHHAQYPALPAGAEPRRGQVIVACMIGVDGRLRESRIYQSVGPEYDREALRVVEGLRGTFTPQLIDGEPVESFYTLEVNFIPPRPKPGL